MTHLIEQWHRPANVFALQTTQSLDSFNHFSVHPSDANPDLMKLLVDNFQLPHEPMFLHQVHENNIVEYHSRPGKQMQIQADACFTRQPDVICAIMTADCLPVLLTDAKGSFIAAIHCGWRSLYANILEETMSTINPSAEVLAWFGPCIQQAQYEVGEDFVEHYVKKHPESKPAFTLNAGGKSLADLTLLATSQLQQAGVCQIEKDPRCTFLDPDFHSWRQDQTTMRMATMAWLYN